jgi:cytochrome c biogenesis factor
LKYEKIWLLAYLIAETSFRSVLKVNKGNHELGELYPRKDYYINAQQIVTVPSIHITWRNDVYVILLDWQNSPVDKSVFKIYINPFAMWLGIGSFIVLFATAILILRKVANSSISHDEISSMF